MSGEQNPVGGPLSDWKFGEAVKDASERLQGADARLAESVDAVQQAADSAGRDAAASAGRAAAGVEQATASAAAGVSSALSTAGAAGARSVAAAGGSLVATFADIELMSQLISRHVSTTMIESGRVFPMSTNGDLLESVTLSPVTAAIAGGAVVTAAGRLAAHAALSQGLSIVAVTIVSTYQLADTALQVSAASMRFLSTTYDEIVSGLLGRASGEWGWEGHDGDALLVPAGVDAGDPEAVAQWWSSLTAAERASMMETHPLVVGNLEGVPYGDRDDANRLALELMLQGDDLSFDQRAALEAVRRELDSGGSPTQLILLDVLDGSARAAIAVGDLDSADYATVIVPGMNSTVKDSMGNTMDSAGAVLDQMEELLLRSDGGTAAVVAWIGYEAPGYFTVGQGDHARTGAVHLSTMIEGYRATQDHAGRTPFLHVLAHSYGSTTAANAVAETSGVDAFTMFGSAGIENTIGSAGDLKVPAGQVYVTESPDDGWADAGRNISGRQDPLAAGFDAVSFGSRDTTGHGMYIDPADPGVESDTGPQYGYLNPGTQSLDNIALIAVGEGAHVTK